MSTNSPFDTDESNTTSPQNSNKSINNFSSQNFTGINYVAFPFHHLISAKELSQESQSREANFHLKNLKCRFVEQNEFESSKELIWEVRHFNTLEGCGEIYRAEMLTLKRAVYESEEHLPKTIKIEKEDLQKYFDFGIFKSLSDQPVKDLFFDNLLSPFKLTLNTNGISEIKDKNYPNISESSNLFSIHGSSRIAEWAELNEKESFEITLSSYWQDWQQLARKAKFDFELLENLTDVHVRFYELTKFLSVSQENNSKDESLCEVEMDYEKFAMLMPLRKLLSADEIKSQIYDLINLLEKVGYIKHFSLKNNQPKFNSYKLFFQLTDNLQL